MRQPRHEAAETAHREDEVLGNERKLRSPGCGCRLSPGHRMPFDEVEDESASSIAVRKAELMIGRLIARSFMYMFLRNCESRCI